VRFIEEHLDRKLILVSAAAGYGKTSLLVDFADRTSLPVCWYSIDKTDRDPVVLLEGLGVTIGHTFPGFPSGMISKREPSAPVLADLQHIVASLARDIRLHVPERFVLILDDLQKLNGSDDANQALGLLLQYLPSNCHLVMAGRTLPTLPLIELSAHQEVAGLGTEDLQFSAQEIQELFRGTFGLSLSDQEAHQLAEQTEGWITAILLSASDPWKGNPPDVTQLGEHHDALFAYLGEQVFECQPQEIRSFLETSAILRRMSAELCDQLREVDDSAQLITTLEARNLFLFRTGPKPGWFIYHTLFREFLLGRFRQRDEDRFLSLHRHAGEIWEKEGVWSEAIYHYLQCCAYRHVAEILETSGQSLFEAGRLQVLTEWLDGLPEEVVKARPKILLLQGRIATEQGHLDLATAILNEAETGFVEDADTSGQAEALVRKAIITRMRGDYQEAAEQLEKALELLGSNLNESLVAAEAHKVLAESCFRMGHLPKAEHEARLALKLYEAHERPAHVARLLVDLGIILRQRGRPTEALASLHRAYQIAQETGQSYALAEILNNMGVVYHQEGDFFAALQTFERGLEKAREVHYLRLMSGILASVGDLYRDLGELKEAEELYKEALEISERIESLFRRTYLLDALANLYRLDRDFVSAERFLSEACDLAKTSPSDYLVGLTERTMGLLARDKGRRAEAALHLSRALLTFAQGAIMEEMVATHLCLASVCDHKKDEARLHQHLDEAIELAESTATYRPFLVEAIPAEIDLSDYDPGLSTRLRKAEESRRRCRREIRIRREAIRPIPSLRVYLFGDGEVHVTERRVSKTKWGGPLTKELFFYLFEGGPLRREQIGVVLWPDSSYQTMTRGFKNALYRLRKAVFPQCAVYDGDTDQYLFNEEIAVWSDVREFERLITEARKWPEGSKESRRLLRRAVGLYRGDYLEDIYSDWCQERREDLRQKCVKALIDLGNSYLEEGSFEEAIRFYRKVLSKEPYREDVLQRLMRCYVLVGTPSKALQEFQRYSNGLKEEMGLSPLPQTREMYLHIAEGKSETTGRATEVEEFGPPR
jgi:ATP/maltotriose-dependent transcriptional regulator MalT/two-component SAPR family response regulator